MQTIIDQLKGNVAKGRILNSDLSTESCFIVKGQNKFAHGKTLKIAVRDLQNKIFEDLDVEEKIVEFNAKFKDGIKYEAKEFYACHRLLTGSCEQGRDNFVRNKGIKLTDKMTVAEFIEICKNDYGGEIIRQLGKRGEH